MLNSIDIIHKTFLNYGVFTKKVGHIFLTIFFAKFIAFGKIKNFTVPTKVCQFIFAGHNIDRKGGFRTRPIKKQTLLSSSGKLSPATDLSESDIISITCICCAAKSRQI